LINVAKGGQKELSLDYQAFLRQRGLAIWDKDDPRTKAIRALAYTSNRSYMTYRTYIQNPEAAANCALCLIFQTTYLLDQQMKALEKELLANGDVREQFRQARNEEQKRRMLGGDDNFAEFLAQFGQRQLEDGRVVTIGEEERTK
jgi:restriction system protein